MRLPLACVSVLVLGGCFDFDALRATRGDAGTGPDGGADAPRDVTPDAQPPARVTPRYWDEATAEALWDAATGDVVLAGMPATTWVIETGPDAPEVRQYEGLKRGDTIPTDDPAQLVPGLDVRVVNLVGGVEAAVLVARSFTVENGGRLFGIGTRPLVILAAEDIRVSGAIDVGSGVVVLTVPTSRHAVGAGANSCTEGRGVTGTSGSSQGAGGGGGSYATVGGGGGVFNEAPATSPGVVLAGLPTTLQGGCAGGAGGTASDVVAEGGAPPGGAGGGALQLAAAREISLGATAIVSAGGLGGARGLASRGGGGGGSGGLIVLDAPVVLAQGGVGAPGGGGGQGAGCNLACSIPATSARGAAGYVALPFVAAAGGAAVNQLTNVRARGGDGSDADGVATAGAPVQHVTGVGYSGGGGGGGGAGFVLIRHGGAYDAAGATFIPVVDGVTPVVAHVGD